MSTVDEKLDRLIVIVEHLAEDVQEVKSDLKEFLKIPHQFFEPISKALFHQMDA